MESRFAQAEIWRVRRAGDDVMIEVYSHELEKWIELRLTRAQALTFTIAITEAGTK